MTIESEVEETAKTILENIEAVKGKRYVGVMMCTMFLKAATELLKTEGEARRRLCLAHAKTITTMLELLGESLKRHVPAEELVTDCETVIHATERVFTRAKGGL